MNENQEIDERCACGATFRWRGEFVTQGREVAADWRRGHHHALGLVEQGRRLASLRDDFIAQGVDPGELEIPRGIETNAVHVIDARHTDSHTIYTCAVCGYEGLDVPDLPCPGKPITGGGPCLAG